MIGPHVLAFVLSATGSSAAGPPPPPVAPTNPQRTVGAPPSAAPAPVTPAPVASPAPAPAPAPVTPAPAPAPAPVTPAPVAAAAPAPAPGVTPVAAPSPALDPAYQVEAASYQQLQSRTGLDLSRLWNDYPREHRAGETFYDFARNRYRRRLAAGITFSVLGLGLSAAGMAMVLIAAGKDTDAGEIDVIGGALVLTAGFCFVIPGAILWPTSQIRLHKLKQARQTAALPRLRALGPIPVRQGAGLGLALAF